MATVVTPHALSQSAKRYRSAVKVEKTLTETVSRLRHGSVDLVIANVQPRRIQVDLLECSQFGNVRQVRLAFSAFGYDSVSLLPLSLLLTWDRISSGPMQLELCSLPNGVACAPPVNKPRSIGTRLTYGLEQHQCAGGLGLPEPEGIVPQSVSCRKNSAAGGMAGYHADEADDFSA